MGMYRIKERSTGKVVVSDFQADGPIKAEAHCPRPRGSYVIELVATGTPARESASLQTVQLRETHNLGVVLDAVTRAVQSTDAMAQDVEVLDDNSTRYRVGVQLFQRSWGVTDGDDGLPAVTLGNPQEIEMVAQPKEAYRALLKVSEAMNPGRDDNFHAEFLRGPAGSSGSLEELGRVWGNEGEYLESFLKGR